ncbi:MAG: hypothetical protein KKH01_03320 [Firmicutes bacterium]|nr:hypothetical protein [Bacillota bacterium]
MKEKRLFQRLDDLALVLSKKEHTLALMALGSVGTEQERVDEFSDLDFFVIVEDEFKAFYLNDLAWMSEVCPLAYQFKNTVDGYKVLFEDGIYGEFAVFGSSDMATVTQPNGRLVWKSDQYQYDDLTKMKGNIPKIKTYDPDFAINEALTNIYVGLLRALRGEKLSGYLYLESYALNRILSIVHLYEKEVPIFEDVFGVERRFEKHYPEFAKKLPKMLSGYQNIGLSAKAMLDYLDSIYPINQKMKYEIEKLIARINTVKL